MWLFIQEQILGMKWLNEIIGRLLSIVGVNLTSRLGGSLQFFFYDVIKITILLCILIFSISYIHSYFPPERSRKILSHYD
ncbi:permease, partial [Streptococcus suis]